MRIEGDVFRRTIALYDGFVSTTPRVGLWLDTRDLTPEETVAQILRS